MNQPDPPILDYAGPKLDPRVPEVYFNGRDGVVVRRPSAQLPKRCIICNARVARVRKVTLSYVDPEIRKSYRGGIMFYWVYLVVLIVRGIHEHAAKKSVTVSYSVCAADRSMRGSIIFLRVSLLIACIALLPTARLMGFGEEIVFGSCIAIVINLIFPWPKRQLRIERITESYAVITGPSTGFLKSLPRSMG